MVSFTDDTGFDTTIICFVESRLDTVSAQAGVATTRNVGFSDSVAPFISGGYGCGGYGE